MKKIYSLLLILFATSLISFAQGTPVGKISTIKPIDIEKTVRNKNLTRIAALQTTEKLNKVKELLKGKVEPQKLNSLTMFSPINLTVRNSMVEEKAFLAFDFSETISAYENYAFFSPNDNEPKLKIFFNAPAAGWYVFDFYMDVSSNSSTAFKFINFISDVQERNIKDGLNQHQIFVTQFSKAGWGLVYLSNSKGVWKFHNVEVSQLK